MDVDKDVQQLSRALDKREYLVIIRNPSSEWFRQDSSDEGSQHMVLMKNYENYHEILPLIKSCGCLVAKLPWFSIFVTKGTIYVCLLG